MRQINILLLEDDEILQEIIAEYLQSKQYFVTTCNNTKEALDLSYEKNFDLWLFDIKVPGDDSIENGLELLKSLREVNKNTPTIFISSLSSINDIEMAYNIGCDDYLRKPFEFAELDLRIKTILKRTFTHQNTELISISDDIQYNIYNKVLYKQNKIVPITNKETKLLQLFLTNIEKVLEKDVIFAEVWEYDEMPSELSLRAYIKNLRKIIGKNKIISKRNAGYIYVP